PGSLCPFCDQELPVSPSPELVAFGARMHDISLPDPIPGNPGHRKPTSMTRVGGYCEQHRMEREILPLAIAGKWLFNPDFDKLLARTLALGPELTTLCEEIDDSSFFRASKKHYTPSSSMPGSQPMSMAQMTSVGQQYASTGRLRELGPGYYGEIGYQILMVALRFMFPDTPDVCSLGVPLPYDIMLREVLFPEAVVRIIQEDLSIKNRAAKTVMRESYLFGVVRHPSSGESDA
ncbi:hypothetical protein DFH06DRAFT_936843, partial [Mycena polygramma]